MKGRAGAFTIACALAGAGAGHGQDGEWVTLTSLRLARQETGAARIGGTIYVVGGLVANGAATASVEAYEVSADRWLDVAPMPAPRDHAAVAALGGKLYVAGGFAGDFRAIDTVFVYDPAGDAWSESARLPSARGGAWSVELGRRLYLFGGVDRFGIARRESFVYDPAAGQWSEAALMPSAREHLNAVAVDGLVYVIGGRAGGASAANERYDPGTNTWLVLEPLPTARSAMALAALNGRIHAMGGEVPRLFDTHEVYDPATNSWTLGQPMPIPRHGVPAVALGDRILVPGGGTVQGLDPTAHVDAFVVDGTSGGGCVAGDETLCLQGGRFSLVVEWRDPADGAVRRARARSQVDQTGIFSFFDDENFELLVKVLDGRAINGAFWLFYGALSDVEYTIFATDTSDGRMRLYHNPEGRLASAGDVDAFPADDDVGAPTEAAAAAAASSVPGRVASGGAAACVEDEETLCLQGGRFSVRVTWRASNGTSGLGSVLESSRTDPSGLFTFFDPGNVELALKLLDGRALNGHFWLFYGALSDLEYTVTLSDTHSGATREYVNTTGRFVSAADLEAFGDP
ncbi:MAG TPA: kelch repeat-containing protein [Thermoanaerobaculia bacterium]|nr:kelch repeat-containing protein [Thermoanaerobaculia bacterium]